MKKAWIGCVLGAALTGTRFVHDHIAKRAKVVKASGAKAD